jgi:hypothetical protein
MCHSNMAEFTGHLKRGYTVLSSLAGLDICTTQKLMHHINMALTTSRMEGRRTVLFS